MAGATARVRKNGALNAGEDAGRDSVGVEIGANFPDLLHLLDVVADVGLPPEAATAGCW